MEATHDGELFRYINLKLAALGQPTSQTTTDPAFIEIAAPLLRNYHQKNQLLRGRLCPADARIQAFLDDYLRGVLPEAVPRLPSQTLVLDRPGLARVLSLPPTGDTLASPYVRSYRIRQGILHNPKSDRRTTKGIFHIAEGGLPIPADKIAVPKRTFGSLLALALTPPAEVLELPFTADQDHRRAAAVHHIAAASSCMSCDRRRPGKVDGDAVLRACESREQSGFRGTHLR